MSCIRKQNICWRGILQPYLYLILNGRGVPEKPNYGNWGGRYEFYILDQQKWHYEQEARCIWTDAVDEVIGIDGKTYKTNQATIWRWRQASQHDFAARIDWTVAENYQDANHNPVAAFAHDTSKGVVTLEVKSGEVVRSVQLENSIRTATISCIIGFYIRKLMTTKERL